MISDCAILFVRQPVRGRVKTRLGAEIRDDLVLDLYRCFVEDTASMLGSLKVHIRCCYDGPGGPEVFRAWLGDGRSYVRQNGADLGRRMANAFGDAFAAGASKVVLIGSDLPDLPADIVRQGFDRLDTHGAVIGPSRDGGYYLIGFARPCFVSEAFAGIAWSTDRVFEQTRQILTGRDVEIHVLPAWHDVDTWSDLQDLIRRNAGTPFCRSRTWAFARACGWVGDEEEGSESHV